jgi:hypothetical protein
MEMGHPCLTDLYRSIAGYRLTESSLLGNRVIRDTGIDRYTVGYRYIFIVIPRFYCSIRLAHSVSNQAVAREDLTIICELVWICQTPLKSTGNILLRIAKGRFAEATLPPFRTVSHIRYQQQY